MAERVGFEPTVPSLGSPVFKTGSLNRSDISPNRPCYSISSPAFCQEENQNFAESACPELFFKVSLDKWAHMEYVQLPESL